MIIEFRCEREHARRWMDRQSLAVDGRDVPVQIAWTATADPRPAGLEGLFELERMVLRKGKRSGADRLNLAGGTSRAAAGEADVIVDFTPLPRDPRSTARLYLRPLFNGKPGE